MMLRHFALIEEHTSFGITLLACFIVEKRVQIS